MQEPPKALQLQYEAGIIQAVPRRAYAVMEVPAQLQVITAFVSLDGTPSVTSWESVSPCCSYNSTASSARIIACLLACMWCLTASSVT